LESFGELNYVEYFFLVAIMNGKIKVNVILYNCNIYAGGGQAFYIQIKNEIGSYVKINAICACALYVSFKSMGKRASEKKEKRLDTV
jgi:hypothetical protein